MFKLFKKKKKEVGRIGVTLGGDETIASIMRKIAEHTGYSQKELSYIIGTNPSTVSKWLSGAAIPKVTDFVKFCKACDYEVVIFKS